MSTNAKERLRATFNPQAPSFTPTVPIQTSKSAAPPPDKQPAKMVASTGIFTGANHALPRPLNGLAQAVHESVSSGRLRAPPPDNTASIWNDHEDTSWNKGPWGESLFAYDPRGTSLKTGLHSRNAAPTYPAFESSSNVDIISPKFQRTAASRVANDLESHPMARNPTEHAYEPVSSPWSQAERDMAARDPQGWATLAKSHLQQLFGLYPDGTIPHDVLEAHFIKYQDAYPGRPTKQPAQGTRDLGSPERIIRQSHTHPHGYGSPESMPSQPHTGLHGYGSPAQMPSHARTKSHEYLANAHTLALNAIQNNTQASQTIASVGHRGRTGTTSTQTSGLYPISEESFNPGFHQHRQQASFSPGKDFPALGAIGDRTSNKHTASNTGNRAQQVGPGHPSWRPAPALIPSTPQYVPVHLLNRGNRRGSIARKPRKSYRAVQPRRTDQGPLPSAADIYPDDNINLPTDVETDMLPLGGGDDIGILSNSDHLVGAISKASRVKNAYVDHLTGFLERQYPLQNVEEKMPKSYVDTSFHLAGLGQQNEQDTITLPPPDEWINPQYLPFYPDLTTPSKEQEQEQVEHPNATNHNNNNNNPLEIDSDVGIDDLICLSPLSITGDKSEFEFRPRNFNVIRQPAKKDLLSVYTNTRLDKDQITGTRYGLAFGGLGLRSLGDCWMPAGPGVAGWGGLSGLAYLWD